MKLGEIVKLQILMTCDLYKTEQERTFDPKFISEAITEKNTWAIPFKYEGYGFDNGYLPTYVKEVMNFLNMWEDIERSYSMLNSQDQTKVKNTSNFVEFEGFDKINENNYYSAAFWFIKKLGLYQYFKDRSLNSYVKKIDKYQNISQKYSSIKNSYTDYKAYVLTASDLIKIFN